MNEWTQLIIALTALIATIIGFIKLWYDIQKVHTIVNSQRTAMEKKIEKLNNLLNKKISSSSN